METTIINATIQFFLGSKKKLGFLFFSIAALMSCTLAHAYEIKLYLDTYHYCINSSRDYSLLRVGSTGIEPGGITIKGVTAQDDEQLLFTSIGCSRFKTSAENGLLNINIYCEPSPLWITDCALEDSQLDYAELGPLKFSFTYSDTQGYGKLNDPTMKPTLNGYIQTRVDNRYVSPAPYSPPVTPYEPEDEGGYRRPIDPYIVICNCIYHGYSTSAIIELLDSYAGQISPDLNESDLALRQELAVYKLALTMGNRPLQARELIDIARQFEEIRDFNNKAFKDYVYRQQHPAPKTPDKE